MGMGSSLRKAGQIAGAASALSFGAATLSFSVGCDNNENPSGNSATDAPTPPNTSAAPSMTELLREAEALKLETKSMRVQASGLESE